MIPIATPLSPEGTPVTGYAVMINGVKVGEILRDYDGYWYFWPEMRCGYWMAPHMRWIADKIDELDAPYEAELKAYFDGKPGAET